MLTPILFISMSCTCQIALRRDLLRPESPPKRTFMQEYKNTTAAGSCCSMSECLLERYLPCKAPQAIESPEPAQPSNLVPRPTPAADTSVPQSSAFKNFSEYRNLVTTCAHMMCTLQCSRLQVHAWQNTAQGPRPGSGHNRKPKASPLRDRPAAAHTP